MCPFCFLLFYVIVWLPTIIYTFATCYQKQLAYCLSVCEHCLSMNRLGNKLFARFFVHFMFISGRFQVNFMFTLILNLTPCNKKLLSLLHSCPHIILPIFIWTFYTSYLTLIFWLKKKKENIFFFLENSTFNSNSVINLYNTDILELHSKLQRKNELGIFILIHSKRKMKKLVKKWACVQLSQKTLQNPVVNELEKANFYLEKLSALWILSPFLKTSGSSSDACFKINKLHWKFYQIDIFSAFLF